MLQKVGLGTVQWGLPYGIAHRGNATAPDEVGRILAAARTAGIAVLDTAALYGNSESVLGNQGVEEFRVVTKTPALARSGLEAADDLSYSFERSLARLQLPAVYGLLVHHAEDLLRPGAEYVIGRMQELKAAGLVQKIGISAYDGIQVRAVLELFHPDLVQLPLNVLDQRLLSDGTLDVLRARNVEVHARSAFMQGLLLMPLDRVPPYFGPILPLLRKWHNACAESGSTPGQAALSFVRNMPQVDCCLVGVQDLRQLQQCLSDFEVNVSLPMADFACNNPVFVNPSLWETT